MKFQLFHLEMFFSQSNFLDFYTTTLSAVAPDLYVIATSRHKCFCIRNLHGSASRCGLNVRNELQVIN